MKEYYSYLEMADKCEEMMRMLAPVPEGYGIGWFTIEKINNHGIDDKIAESIDALWHGDKLRLKPEESLSLLCRLKFAIWFLDVQYAQKSHAPYHRKEALLRTVSAATDLWHSLSAIWMLTIAGEPGFLGRNIAPTIDPCDTSLYCHKWRSSYEDELTHADLFVYRKGSGKK